jgi:hypothetical protein
MQVSTRDLLTTSLTTVCAESDRVTERALSVSLQDTHDNDLKAVISTLNCRYDNSDTYSLYLLLRMRARKLK